MQWEAKIVKAYDIEVFEKKADHYGCMGWELVSGHVEHGYKDIYVGFFKRPRKHK